MNIPLLKIESGEDNDVFWVSLGYTSEEEKDDVLHIVCAKKIDQQDIDLGMDEIYLERRDQKYSCYDGVISIEVKTDSIEVIFNEHGHRAIKIAPSVKFHHGGFIQNYEGAIKVLKEMAKTHCGWVVDVTQGKC